jgi:hypothetical protein
MKLSKDIRTRLTTVFIYAVSILFIQTLTLNIVSRSVEKTNENPKRFFYSNSFSSFRTSGEANGFWGNGQLNR